MKNKVFLGGTWNNSTWREELIPKLKIPYFNPVVDNWTEENIAIEEKEKQESSIHLYVITAAMTGVYSIAEIITSSYLKNVTTIMQVVPSGFEKDQLKSLDAVGKLLEKQGGIYIKQNSFDELISIINLGISVCPACGGTDLLTRAWVDQSTEFIEYCDDDEYWCNDCEEIVYL
jgi:hypothetical protein